MTQFDEVAVPDLENELFAPYWRGLKAGHIEVQCCTRCGTFQWPPLTICPVCHTATLDWVERQPMGKVFVWTTVHHPSAVGHPDVPYVVAVVELDDTPGVRVVGLLTGLSWHQVEAGMPVVATFPTAGQGQMNLILWTPREMAQEAGT